MKTKNGIHPTRRSTAKSHHANNRCIARSRSRYDFRGSWEQPQFFVTELRTAFKSLRGEKATALNR